MIMGSFNGFSDLRLWPPFCFHFNFLYTSIIYLLLPFVISGIHFDCGYVVDLTNH